VTGRLAEYVGHSVQIGLGFVFLVAAVPKLRRPASFVAAVREYRLVPPALSGAVAIGVVALESLVAVSLLTGRLSTIGLATAGVLLGGLAVAVGINLRKGREVSCGCFGSASERISPRTLLRIGMLLVATAALVTVQVAGWLAPLDAVRVAREGVAGVERLTVTATFTAFLFVVATTLYHIPEIRELLRRLPGRT
jgi:Methylamine utilisation protein MauE